MKLSVCVCTMDRTDTLRRCLQSVADAELLPWEVIVSDDSRAPAKTVELCAEFPFARYVRGPQAGLCANRNHIVRAAKGDFLALMDDDALLSPDFVTVASRLLSRTEGRTIWTGDVLEYGQRFTPRNPSFWGHFIVDPGGGRRETINLNCCLFPRTAFAAAQFDEKIAYGYEDMDLCAHLLARGFRIDWSPDLTNRHEPPHDSPDVLRRRHRQAESARFYTSLRRYGAWQKKPGKAALYALLAPLHRMAFDVKIRNWNDIPHSVTDMRDALRLASAPRSETDMTTLSQQRPHMSPSPTLLRVTVMIPSYRRPDDLRRCLDALKGQTRPAFQVVVAVRDTDDDTRAMLAAYDAGDLPLEIATVTEPGAVAAMNAGAQAARGDITAITDDDAAPWPDWLERIGAHFEADVHLGGVGGRDWLRGVPAMEFGKHDTTKPGSVGVVKWFGRVVGDHHIGEGDARPVDVLKGVNCAYRTQALQTAGFDTRLWGRGAQIHWELALGYAIKGQNYTLVYDPAVGVDHYQGRRHDEDQRLSAFNFEAHRNIIHNETLILLEHMTRPQRLAFYAWAFWIGTRFAPGLAQVARLWVKRQPFVGGFWAASRAGQWAGWRSWHRVRRSGKTTL